VHGPACGDRHAGWSDAYSTDAVPFYDRCLLLLVPLHCTFMTFAFTATRWRRGIPMVTVFLLRLLLALPVYAPLLVNTVIQYRGVCIVRLVMIRAWNILCCRLRASRSF